MFTLVDKCIKIVSIITIKINLVNWSTTSPENSSMNQSRNF